MKKTLLLAILCATLLAGCADTSVSPVSPVEEEEKVMTREDAFKIYAKKVQELEEDYGVLALDIDPYGIPNTKWYTVNGLSYLSLTDFDNDGIEELVAVCGRYGCRQLVRVYTAKENGLKEIYCNYVGGGGSPVISQVEIMKQGSKNYLMRQTATPTFDVYEMRDGIMKSRGIVESGGTLTFYNDPGEIKEEQEESRKQSNSFIFNFPEEYCPEASDDLLASVNSVKNALSLETQDAYEILNSPDEMNLYSYFLYSGCTIAREVTDEATNSLKTVYDPVFKGEDTKKEYAFDDLDGDGVKEMLLREDQKDLYIIRTNYGDFELVTEGALISAAKDSKATFTDVPEKERFTSPYSLDAEEYLYSDMTIRDAIAINGEEYDVGDYEGRVIVKYENISFFPRLYDTDKLTFDMNSTIDKVMIFGDRRVNVAVYGNMTFPELEEAMERSYMLSNNNMEKTYNETEDREEYLLEVDGWDCIYRFKWVDDPETSPCDCVEVLIKEG